jgi:DNA-binding FadR family transcriptional regulator
MNPEISETQSMQPVRAFEKVSIKIKEMILKGVMKPGDRLPSEAELANRFQVGRQSVREALRILEFSGFISIQKSGRNSGVIIQDNILKTISDLFVDALVFGKLTLDHLTIARLEIEKRVVFYAINNAREKDYLSLEENIARAREKIALNEPTTEENILFHQLLAQASGNRVFVIVIGVLLTVLRDCLSRLSLDLSGKNDRYGFNEGIKRSRQVVTYHEDILQAIRHRDHELAETLMEEHLMDLRDRLLALEIDGK